MEVAGVAGAVEVELAVGVTVGADADFGEVGVFVEEVGGGDPAFFGGVFVGVVEPVVADALGDGEGEHAGAGGFAPGFGVVDELVPGAVVALELFEGGHHFVVAVEDACALGMGFGEI